VCCERFGSLRNAYRRIGYETKWDFDWIDRKTEFKMLLGKAAADLVSRLEKAGSVAWFEPGIDVLHVNQRFAISLRLARPWSAPNRNLIWTINRRATLPKGHIIAIRLGEESNRIHYLLLPTNAMTSSKIRFMDAGLDRFSGCRFDTPARLTKAILDQINVVARRSAC
jgi:hypothetical protein